MSVVYSTDDRYGDIPENIIQNIRNVYSHYTVRVLNEETIVEVPKDEMREVGRFYESFNNVLLEIQKENHVLAIKLARNYGLKLQK